MSHLSFCNGRSWRKTQNAYKNTKSLSFTLSFINGKRKSPPLSLPFQQKAVSLQRRSVIMKTSKEYIEMIRQHEVELRQRFGISSMFLFGSVARDEHHQGSDIDLFVTMPPKLFNHILAAQYLEELLGCPVDLIQDHKHLRPFFRDQITQDGINVFTTA